MKGPDRAGGTELGALEAMADGLRGPWPQPGPYSRNPYYHPKKKKKFPGEVRGYQEPSGTKQTGQYKTRRQDRTEHDDRKALQGQTDRIGHPTGTRSPPGLARRLRLLLGMTRSQGPSQGPSATASTLATRRVSMDKTRHDMVVKMFLWAQQDRHTALLAVTCGLDPRG